MCLRLLAFLMPLCLLHARKPLDGPPAPVATPRPGKRLAGLPAGRLAPVLVSRLWQLLTSKMHDLDFRNLPALLEDVLALWGLTHD
jgi:hypothetical protein